MADRQRKAEEALAIADRMTRDASGSPRYASRDLERCRALLVVLEFRKPTTRELQLLDTRLRLYTEPSKLAPDPLTETKENPVAGDDADDPAGDA